ncbi:bifunctional aminoglycoside phosphotransferase/ATP-binding protein [Aporhodopirellula aestuarii]|uniref:AAA family ATPase n=1 Tax=Aporhodopirellula aestuarii TaxID=2950107 RepID=A0ABT0TZ55_9BACT|nr:bifunctional aminoglycoside phosphotransferase/ATP-binding protein [Aporhodopirellula aestuarii]MCM2369855.1 AAA family ATPase [Aporhodopirellula aestuarii]
MPTSTGNPNTKELVDSLSQPDAYRYPIDGDIEICTTHISNVFLAGDYVFKVKKPITTNFLDYSTLELRKHYCDEEVRLGKRYDEDLYQGVVAISLDDGKLRVEGDGEPVEFAVKMKRFPSDALLSERIKHGVLTSDEVVQLAGWLGTFHQNAAICDPEFAKGWTGFLKSNSLHILEQLEAFLCDETIGTLQVLRNWSDEYLCEHRDRFERRVEGNFIRECHGDLHLQNVVHWGDRLIPFDGIESSERLRWIDVLSDAAFLSMDLAARGHLDLSRSFINAYVQRTGDYESLELLRWFLFYRAIVRAMVPAMRASQLDVAEEERVEALADAHRHVDLAYRFTLREEPSLWITHGVSGSGKTTLSETVIQRHECFRVVSDVERKRMQGIRPTERVVDEMKTRLYSDAHTEATYQRLATLSRGILRAGYSVIVDATFLKQKQRELFVGLAEAEGVAFRILECRSDRQTLHQRVADRIAKDTSASDADVKVLEAQLAQQEPLTDSERRFAIEIPSLVSTVERL